MLDACDKIAEFTKGRERDEVLENAVIRQIAIIGEAANAVSKELKDARPEIPWRVIVDMRNFVIHDYDRINPKRVWEIVDRDGPKLRGQVQSILDDIDQDGKD